MYKRQQFKQKSKTVRFELFRLPSLVAIISLAVLTGALCVNAQRAYWGNHQTEDTLSAANLDGSNAITLYDAGTDDTFGPLGPDMDQAGSKVYFGDANAKLIGSADADGSNFQELVDTGSEHPQFTALDEANNHLYWSEYEGNVGKYDLGSGSIAESNFASGDSSATGLALDDNNLYIADAGAQSIFTKPLDGSSGGTLVDNLGDDPYELELHDGNIYYGRGDTVGKIGVDGSDHDDSFISGFDGTAFGVSVHNNELYIGERSGTLYKAGLDGSGLETVMDGVDGTDFAPFGVHVIPEPNTLALLLLGSYLLIFRRRRASAA